MTYETTPSGNKWAKQYSQVEIPIYLNTSDSGEAMDYAPKDRREGGADCWMCNETGDASFPNHHEVPCDYCPNGYILKERLESERRASEAVEPPKLQREGSTPFASANDNLFVPECLYDEEEDKEEVLLIGWSSDGDAVADLSFLISEELIRQERFGMYPSAIDIAIAIVEGLKNRAAEQAMIAAQEGLIVDWHKDEKDRSDCW